MIVHDPYGNVATGYTGTVDLSSTDPRAVLPAYTFTATDAGTHTFAVTLVHRRHPVDHRDRLGERV